MYIIILFILFAYLFISVISYSQLLSSILVSGNHVILFVCFSVYILREVKYKYALIYMKKNVISDVNREEFVGTFYKKELQKANKKEFRVEK